MPANAIMHAMLCNYERNVLFVVHSLATDVKELIAHSGGAM
jgi:hypothetical protein